MKFPEEYDGNFFAGEFGHGWITRTEQGDDGTVQKSNPFLWTGTQVIDMAFGPGGGLATPIGQGRSSAKESACQRVNRMSGMGIGSPDERPRILGCEYRWAGVPVFLNLPDWVP
ncbi:hypothetical protein GCM10009578_008690 [Streptomyces rhizosphaericus]